MKDKKRRMMATRVGGSGSLPDELDLTLLAELLCQEGCEIAAIRRLLVAMVELTDEEMKEKVLPLVRRSWVFTRRPACEMLDTLEDSLCDITGKELSKTDEYLREERRKRREG